MPENQKTVHATCVEIQGHGILLRGKPGSGKSDLALRLIEHGAVLVSDDQVCLSEVDNAVFASPPYRLQGLLEVRGVGICRFEFVPQTQIALIFDLVDSPLIERLPDTQAGTTVLVSTRLNTIPFYPFETSACAKVKAALDLFARL